MRTLFAILLMALPSLYGQAHADDRKQALIGSYTGEYSLITECDLFYYGIGRPRDFAKARACYGHDPVLEIVSYANGHGVEQDLARARHLASKLNHFLKEEILADLDKLENTTDKHELEPCDYAYSTPDLVYCNSLSKLREEIELYELNAAYRKHPDTHVRTSWVELEAAMRDFSDAESAYISDSLEGGSMQRYAPGAATAKIASNHRESLAHLKNYAPHKDATADNYRKVDRLLNEKYRQVLDRHDAEQLRRKLIHAQRKWIKYRDTMVDFFKAVDQSRHPQDKVALDAMILVTQQRVDMW